jgi:formylglycine-generating enzyme required for sulfatase activity
VSRLPDLVSVNGGTAWIGSTPSEVAAAVAEWSDHLVEDRYKVDDLQTWLSKEVPCHPRMVESFLLGRHPVTAGEARAFSRATGWRLPRRVSTLPADVPAWGLSIHDAAAYCTWLAEETGRVVRLPTEVEWEWAARGPGRADYPWGDQFDPARCITFGATDEPLPVGGRPHGASTFGAEDMAGTVEEWTSTWYEPYPDGHLVVDDLYLANRGRYPVLRGGSCQLGGDAARGARRHGPIGGRRFRFTGLRIVVDER